jgi:hypothetical protein
MPSANFLVGDLRSEALRSPEPMGHRYETEDALRSDLPDRIPGAKVQLRSYRRGRGAKSDGVVSVRRRL